MEGTSDLLSQQGRLGLQPQAVHLQEFLVDHIRCGEELGPKNQKELSGVSGIGTFNSTVWIQIERRKESIEVDDSSTTSSSSGW